MFTAGGGSAGAGGTDTNIVPTEIWMLTNLTYLDLGKSCSHVDNAKIEPQSCFFGNIIRI